MRHRSPSAIALVAASAAVLGLAACAAPVSPASSPAATSEASPSPSSSPTSSENPTTEAPDLAAMCEDLLPLETVQERFGEDTALLIQQPAGPLPQIATWSALASGDIMCFWGGPEAETSNANVSLMVRPDSAGEYERDRSLHEEHEAQYGESSDRRFDAFERSTDECFEHRCDYSVLLGDDSTWVTLQLLADQGSSLLSGDAIRDRWDPVLRAALDAAPTALQQAPDVTETPPDCEVLLTLAQATELTGATVTRVTDPAGWIEGGSVVSEKWHPAFNTAGCRWGDELESPYLAVHYVAGPEWARAAALERVDTGPRPGDSSEVTGEAIDIDGARDAWAILSSSGAVAYVDFAVGDVWLQVRGVEADTLRAAEQITANLSAAER